MNSRILILILFFLASNHASYGQVLSCFYYMDSYYGYACFLTIQNPNGLNNFTGIGGSHLIDKSNDDVRYILHGFSPNSVNIPSIICDTFQYAVAITLQQIGLQTLNDYSFKNCKNLFSLNLNGNKITKIDEKAFIANLELGTLSLYYNQLTTLPENVFANQQKLDTLRIDFNNITDLPENIFYSLTNLKTFYMSNNQIKSLRSEWFENLHKLSIFDLSLNKIEELPKNVFSPLEKLIFIWLHGNKLKVIHSDSFGISPKLSDIYFQNNQINAIDERLINNTGVHWFNMTGNLCANDYIVDFSASKDSMRNILQTCFNNYKALDCSVGNLDERVCRLEDKNENLEQMIEVILQENFGSQIEALAKENEEQRSLLEDLQNQVNELASRFCVCSKASTLKNMLGLLGLLGLFGIN